MLFEVQIYETPTTVTSNIHIILKVSEYSELQSAQYLARCLEPENVSHFITTRETPKRRMNVILFTTDTVNKAVNSYESNVVLDDRPHPINNQEGMCYLHTIKIGYL